MTYAQYITDIIYDLFIDELQVAEPGHCMKLSGVADNVLEELTRRFRTDVPTLDTFLLDASRNKAPYITATKLIELRNREERPILVLCPSTLRTAAEDSFGNATFRELPIDSAEWHLLFRLRDQLTPAVRTAFELLWEQTHGTHTPGQLNTYLIDLLEQGQPIDQFGNLLFHLDLLPDRTLANDLAQLKNRLVYNLQCTQTMTAFNLPVYDRVKQLPVTDQTLQRSIAQFLNQNAHLRTPAEIGRQIYEQEPTLNFSHWTINELQQQRQVQVRVLALMPIRGSKGQLREDKNGDYVLLCPPDQKADVTLKFTTVPVPRKEPELAQFQVMLMRHAGAGEYEWVADMGRFACSRTNRDYQTRKLTLNPSVIDPEDNYFFRVVAFDKNNLQLNTNDPFSDRTLQAEWETEQQRCVQAGIQPDKSQFLGKFISDSPSFLFTVDQEEGGEDRTGRDRKDRLSNMVQAYFDYRLRLLRAREIPTLLDRDDADWRWTESNKQTQTNVFIARYVDARFSYQVEMSVKLRQIEVEILANPKQLGTCQVQLTGSEALERGSVTLGAGVLSDHPLLTHFIALRTQLFAVIQQELSTGDGVWETFELYRHRELAAAYVAEYRHVLATLQQQLQQAATLPDDQRRELFDLTYALQHLDIIQLQATVLRQETVPACLIPPLHPLRMGWWLQLLDQFDTWEGQTLDQSSRLAYWNDAVEDLFFGSLFPTNQPLVLAGFDNQYSHEYIGELTYGWGLYLRSVPVERDLESMASRNRLLLQSIQRLFNITGRKQTENDVDKQVVLHHLKNYIQLHPYTEQLNINLFNAGEGQVFAQVLVELEKNVQFKGLRYEFRFFYSTAQGRADRLVRHGEGIIRLLNPDANVSEEAESFTRITGDRLHPRLRVSTNRLEDYLAQPNAYDAHLSFLISPFPLRTFISQPPAESQSYYLNGLLIEPQIDVHVSHETTTYSWARFITNANGRVSGHLATDMAGSLDTLNWLVSYYLSTGAGDSSLPATQLTLSNQDQVLLNLVHRTSDWVITFDHHLGPELYDLPKEGDQVPFLLDYIPGERLLGMNTYLTTKPNEEVEHLITPQLLRFGLPLADVGQLATELLDDLRTISGTIVLQLNSNPNRVLETIGIGLTKRFLARKGVLDSQILVPIDLHQYLFTDKTISESKSRADLMLVQLLPSEQRIHVQVIEIKARTTGLTSDEQTELMLEMTEQMDNTVRVWAGQFGSNTERFDRDLKQKEMADMLSFYLRRAHRYGLLNEVERLWGLQFLNALPVDYTFTFERKGLIFDFGSSDAFQLLQTDDDLTFFLIGQAGIRDLFDSQSAVNTRRSDKSTDDVAEHFTRRTRRAYTIGDNPIPVRLTSSVPVAPTQLTTAPSSESPGETLLLPSSSEQIIDGQLSREEPPVYDTVTATEAPKLPAPPAFDLLIGDDEPGGQYGILGQTSSRKTVAMSLSNTNTISLFGVQGAGKSYTLGVIAEMVLKQMQGINALTQPLAGVIFHYSESQDYAPEFTAMNLPNTRESELQKLKSVYGATADHIDDIILLVPQAKLEERQAEYPNLTVLPLTFSSKELSIKDWLFLMGASDNQSLYMKQINNLMRMIRQNISLGLLEDTIASTTLLNDSQKEQARSRLMLAHEYINDSNRLGQLVKPGRLLIVDLRDELILQDEALGLFVIMLNIFANVKGDDGQPFNKFIVFDEAHKYMNNRQLTQNIVTAIREMRHKGVSLLIASQDPPSLPNEIIELSSILVMHEFRAPQWLKHVQRSLEPTAHLTAKELSSLNAGEAFVWAAKANSKAITQQPVKITIRPRATKHGGATIKAGTH
ncbi:methylation-associated defense system ATP-binding protein MAD8 [Spirosoma endbachense]|uniref:DUF853 family protein n=1 Tax=Spirosoma endbachense TaxID=2666025 RepID=A0A6P1VSE7_9BACT|nr:helicase HerA-like domain-containing protein [Spirosoma endbachense]QHV95615.1 DUF853 family protein [Spirosoma endbachense]